MSNTAPRVLVTPQAALGAGATLTILPSGATFNADRRNKSLYFGVEGFNSAGSAAAFTVVFRASGVQIYRAFFTGTMRTAVPYQGIIVPPTCDEILVTNPGAGASETWISYFVLS